MRRMLLRAAAGLGMGLALLAWGESKAPILRAAIEGPQVETIPASFLQRHSNCRCYIDEAAASELIRFRSPWKVGTVDWNPALVRKAVVSIGDACEARAARAAPREQVAPQARAAPATRRIAR